MKKFLSLSLILMLALALFAGCANNEPASTEEPAAEEPADTVAAVSMVTDEATLLNAFSADGSWIPYLVSDLSTDKELVLEGDFYNKGDSAQDLYRKLAFYAQDSERNITARYTLTAPKLTIKSPNTTIQGGTFAGDVYVEANGFNLAKEAKIEGNIYFASDEFKASADVTTDGTVTGTTEVVADAVSAVSLVTDEASLIDAFSADGSWIPYLVSDLTTDKELVLEGDFHSKGLAENDLYRKLAFYAQDSERNITARYTLTAPKLTIKSPNTSIQGGTFAGDVYVEANGFNLAKDAKIEGNVYFASEEFKASADVTSAGTVTGVAEVK